MKKVSVKLIIIMLLFNISGFHTLLSEVKDQSHNVLQNKKILTMTDGTTRYDKERIENNETLLKVMIITLSIWIALSFYIYVLNRKVKKLEKKLNEE